MAAALPFTGKASVRTSLCYEVPPGGCKGRLHSWGSRPGSCGLPITKGVGRGCPQAGRAPSGPARGTWSDGEVGLRDPLILS